jgi:hypothetical protein
MSGFNSQGVGAAACANAEVVSAVSAAVIKKLLVENRIIVILPAAENSLSCPLFEQITNVIIPSMAASPHHAWRSPFSCDFVISRLPPRDYVPLCI